jgi:hypothetical protein
MPLPAQPQALDIFQAIRGHRQGLDKKRMAIMFGCEASSGYRWITMRSKIAPALARAFVVFNARLNSASKRSPSAMQSVLGDWDRLVEIEGRARGVTDVFSAGRWVPKPVTDKVRLSQPGKPMAKQEPRVPKDAGARKTAVPRKSKSGKSTAGKSLAGKSGRKGARATAVS